ncbi:hypothetical protein M407DRAFT_27590 [Tulasnella calospora MUT 4182]|uniref:F-box domain-containing protein n=1 Tax=Tulasnella calospora MUT 4182 TaxID=1051891 RepID=A0A0C3Q2X9_9AGAM|nr:hypothetical protein M407DRAFT_27590 [Tulasnella calospora MUT 4182]
MGIPRGSLNGLPIELLCNIFRQTIGPESPRRDLCRLSLVCRQWREYVDGSARLWTDISAVDGPAHVRRALEKSKGALIDLRFSESTAAETSLEAFLAEAGPHIARWHSLIAAFESRPSLESALAPLTTGQAPRLETLELCLLGVDDSTSQNTITLFGGASAPSTLSALRLFQISLAGEPLSFSGLLSLSLIHVETISTPQLLEILRGSPWLETVTLADNPGLVAIGSQSSTMQPIELPKPVVLAFIRLDNGGTNCIISNIRIPNRRSLVIGGAIIGVSAWSALFTPAIRHILHTTSPTADLSPSVIRVDVDGCYNCRIQFRGVDLSVLVDGEDRVQKTLGWLVDGLGSEAAECSVHLILDWSEMRPERLAEVPPPLVVKHLSISDYVFGSLEESLCTEMVLPPDFASPEWLFAQMESLSVGFHHLESQKQLIVMLGSRYEQATPRGETGLSRPMSLRSVELRSPPELRTEELVEEIRRIIRGADVFWTNG